MATTTRSDIPGYDMVHVLDELRNPVYQVRRMPSEDVFVAKIVGDEYEPHLPAQRGKLARRISRVVGTTVGWVRIDDHGTTNDGQAFVISPLFERGSLADRLDGTPTPWADAVRWIAAASLSVGNLHIEDIALGHLRPSSILLSAEDEALVAIYGLASRRFDDGTFQFEAPEVVNGEEPGTTSDTYSLALILTTLLIGRTPDFAEPLDEFVGALGDHCPAPIQDVITQSLSIDQEARHRTGADFAHSLRGTAEEALANEHAKLTVTTHFDERELAQHVIQSRAAPVPPPLPNESAARQSDATPIAEPTNREDAVAHSPTAGLSVGPLDDIFDMASVTAPLSSWNLEAGGEPDHAPSEVVGSESLASDHQAGDLTAQDALAELDSLLSAPTDNPFETPGPPTTSSRTSRPNTSSAMSSASNNRRVEFAFSDPKINATNNQLADDVPFIASPTIGTRRRPSPDRLQTTAAARLENFWYANRRSVASALTAVAVAGIGAIVVVLAFRSYQEGQTASVKGAPPPTTEAVVLANLNNDVVFITEPPQTNTTTTTAPPRRRTTTSAAPTSSTTSTSPPAKSNKPSDDEDDEDDSPPTTEERTAETVTIPPEVAEENKGRRGRGGRRGQP